MIGKLKKLAGGNHLRRLCSYLHGPAGERVAGSFTMNLASDDPANILDLMQVQADLSVRAKKPFLHLSISYAPGDNVGEAHMLEDAERILDALGMRGCQAYAVVHADHDYKHFHLVVNRVRPDGRCISDSNSWPKVEAALRQIEHERGHSPVAGRLADVPGCPRYDGPKPAKRGYVQPPAEVIGAMQTALSRPELNARLKAVGWRLDAAPPRAGQKHGGLILRGPNGERAKASSCGRDCSGPALARRFALAEPQRKPQAVGIANVGPSPMLAPTPASSGPEKLAKAIRKARSSRKLKLLTMQPPTTTQLIRSAIRVTIPLPKL